MTGFTLSLISSGLIALSLFQKSSLKNNLSENTNIITVSDRNQVPKIQSVPRFPEERREEREVS